MPSSLNRRVARSEWRVGSEPGAQATGFASHPTPHTRHLAPLFRALALAALSVPCSLSPVPSLAQAPSYKNVGRTPTQDELRRWNISVGIDGKELPPGSGTAAQGAQVFAQKCAACHGQNGEGKSQAGGPRLIGQGTEGIRLFPFSTTLWDAINRSIPLNQEGSLSANEVYALTAFLLHRNGIIEENDVMDRSTLPKVQMPNLKIYIPAKLEDIHDPRKRGCRFGTCP